ncbi:MAG: SusD/RagB family nutrient-binding outer membrane lipoprotein [Cyclobacteriaceae bacterium]|nr:SusD/RagB family nutrient-binding outer membrane lipoprotein [Cyclobacteriaceae bacterium]
MKKIYIYILTIAFLTMPMACDDALDINTDPLAATSAPPNSVLPFVFATYGNRKTTELGTRTTDVTQYLSATFNSPRNGSTSIFLTGNTWAIWYTDVLGNLILLEQDAKAAGPTSNNVAAIAVIMKALAFYELACIWDEVPFTEALNGVDFPFPQFDSQETVLRGSVSFLNEGISLVDGIPAEGNFDVSAGDLIYGGDMDLWRKFANSLKLRILMLIRNKDTSVDGDIVATLAQPLVETNAEATLLRYEDAAGARNAWKQILVQFSGSGTNAGAQFFGAGPVFRDIMFNKNDPRIKLFLDDLSGTDTYPTPNNGSFPTSTQAIISDNVLRGDLPNQWMMPSEMALYRAELALLGVTGDDPDVEMRNGVRLACQFWGQDEAGPVSLTTTEIDDYVASLPDLNALSTADALREVHEQLYVEAFLRPVVGWNHVRRTNTPALEPPPAASITTILKRFNYPPDEVGSNPNTPANLPTDTKVWFEN